MTKFVENLTKVIKSAWQKWQNLWILCVLCHKNHKSDKIIHKIYAFYDDGNCKTRAPHFASNDKNDKYIILWVLYKNHKNHKNHKITQYWFCRDSDGGDTSCRYTTVIACCQSPTAHISRAHGVGVASPRWSGDYIYTSQTIPESFWTQQAFVFPLLNILLPWGRTYGKRRKRKSDM